MLSRPGVDSVSVVSCPNVGYKVKTWLKEKSPEMKIHYNSSKEKEIKKVKACDSRKYLIFVLALEFVIRQFGFVIYFHS